MLFKKESLSLVFKTHAEELFIMMDGIVFQRVGAARENDLAPYVFKLRRFKASIDVNLNLAKVSPYFSCKKPIMYQQWYIIKSSQSQTSRARLFKAWLN